MRWPSPARTTASGTGTWPTSVMYFSPRWKTILGLAPDEVTTSPDEWFGRVHPDDIGPLKTAIAAHCADQSGHFEHEHRVCHRDGEYRWALCRGVVVTDRRWPSRCAWRDR